MASKVLMNDRSVYSSPAVSHSLRVSSVDFQNFRVLPNMVITMEEQLHLGSRFGSFNSELYSITVVNIYECNLFSYRHIRHQFLLIT